MFRRFLEQHDLHRIHFGSDIFPTVEDRDFWDAFEYESCVELAEQEINYTWPIIKATDFMEFGKSGNRVIMEDIHFDRRKHLSLFALAELKENKGRFVPQLVNGIFTVCEESYWGLSAHYVTNIPSPEHHQIDLFAAETSAQLAMIITLLRKPLLDFCPEIVARVEYELDCRIKKIYESRDDYNWMGYSGRTNGKRVNNWNPWILSNVLTVFLLCEQDVRRKACAIRKIMLEVQNYYDALPADGGCDEGTNYWGHAGASLFEIVYQLKCATDGAIDLFDDEKLALIAAYMKKAHTVADRFVVVADAHASGGTESMPILFGFAKETGQKDLMNFSAATYKTNESIADVSSIEGRSLRRQIYHSYFRRQMRAYAVEYPLHGALESLPIMQLAVLRRGDWTLTAKGGHNRECHNHNDVGSFTVYEQETPILVDVGISTYTRWTFNPQTRYTMIPWTQAKNHNVPMLNGIDQKNGREFCAQSFEASEGAIRISFAGAYPAEAGVERVTRDLLWLENGCSVEDSFAFAKGASRGVQEVLMSVLPVRIEDGVAILGERYRISSDVGEISTEYMPFEDAHLEFDWQCEGVTRIVVAADNIEKITIKIEKI